MKSGENTQLVVAEVVVSLTVCMKRKDHSGTLKLDTVAAKDLEKSTWRIHMNVETSVDRRRVAEGIAYSEIEQKTWVSYEQLCIVDKTEIEKKFEKKLFVHYWIKLLLYIMYKA